MSPTASSPLIAAVVAELQAADHATKRKLAAELRPYLSASHAERLLDVHEKAGQLGLHPDTLARMARAGRVPGAKKVGREWRFPAARTEILPIRGELTLSHGVTRPSTPRQRPRPAHSSVAAIRSARDHAR